MKSWLQSQFASRSEDRAPIAPLSIQGTAEHWEPSVQNFVGERGGLQIAELKSAVEQKWAFRFKISKIWRLRDAISDKGIHAYLEHHWAVLELVPDCDASNDGHNIQGTASPGGEHDQYAQSTAQGRSSSAASQDEMRQRSGDATPSFDAHVERADSVVLTSEARLSAEQEASFNPQEDQGMQNADDGVTWFLRVDRFDQADKWFACESFENAMSSKEAREKHYRPSSELMYEASIGEHSMYLECLVPLLVKLAEIKYSVFAKGHHCQWHALLVARIVATLHEFIFPGTLHKDYAPQVSLILTDAKEQQRYATMMAKSFFSPNNAYLWDYPEAPYLKAQISAVQELCRQQPSEFPPATLARKFPDVSLLYRSILNDDKGGH